MAEETKIKHRPRSEVLLLMVLLTGSLFLMLFSHYRSELVTRFRERSYLTVESVQLVFYHLRSEGIGFLSDIGQVSELREENKTLKRKIAELSFKEESYYQQIVADNRRLTGLLEFKEKQPYSLVPVKLTAYSPENYFKIIYIDQGSRKGIEKGMVVVNAQGLVGRIVEVYPRQSKVLLVIDERSKVGVRDRQTGDVGVLQGRGKEGTGDLKYLLNKAEVIIGGELITSGLGGLFPEGIPVGKILTVVRKPYSIFLEVKVLPAVDFGKLEEIFLIRE